MRGQPQVYAKLPRQAVPSRGISRPQSCRMLAAANGAKSRNKQVAIMQNAGTLGDTSRNKQVAIMQDAGTLGDT